MTRHVRIDTFVYWGFLFLGGGKGATLRIDETMCYTFVTDSGWLTSCTLLVFFDFLVREGVERAHVVCTKGQLFRVSRFKQRGTHCCTGSRKDRRRDVMNTTECHVVPCERPGVRVRPLVLDMIRCAIVIGSQCFKYEGIDGRSTVRRPRHV